MSMAAKLSPSVVTIFGANGDLTKRKLVPAFYNLFVDGNAPDKLQIIGVGRAGEHEVFRDKMKEAVKEFSRQPLDEAKWTEFAKCLSFVAGVFEDPALYAKLAETVAKCEKAWATKAIRVHYQSVPPSWIELISTGLQKAGLSHDEKRDRLVVEKPFGHDLDSANALNKKLMAGWHECQVYRIDHYLGKDTVQNILALRFANALRAKSESGVISRPRLQSPQPARRGRRQRFAAAFTRSTGYCGT